MRFLWDVWQREKPGGRGVPRTGTRRTDRGRQCVGRRVSGLRPGAQVSRVPAQPSPVSEPASPVSEPPSPVSERRSPSRGEIDARDDPRPRASGGLHASPPPAAVHAPTWKTGEQAPATSRTIRVVSLQRRPTIAPGVPLRMSRTSSDQTPPPPAGIEQPPAGPAVTEQRSSSGDDAGASPEPQPSLQPQAGSIEQVVARDSDAPTARPRLARSSQVAPPARAVPPRASPSESTRTESGSTVDDRRPPPAGARRQVATRPVRLQRRARPTTVPAPTGPPAPEPSPERALAAPVSPTVAPNASEPPIAESPAAAPGLVRRALARVRRDRAARDEPVSLPEATPVSSSDASTGSSAPAEAPTRAERTFVATAPSRPPVAPSPTPTPAPRSRPAPTASRPQEPKTARPPRLARLFGRPPTPRGADSEPPPKLTPAPPPQSHGDAPTRPPSPVSHQTRRPPAAERRQTPRPTVHRLEQGRAPAGRIRRAPRIPASPATPPAPPATAAPPTITAPAAATTAPPAATTAPPVSPTPVRRSAPPAAPAAAAPLKAPTAAPRANGGATLARQPTIGGASWGWARRAACRPARERRHLDRGRQPVAGRAMRTPTRCTASSCTGCGLSRNNLARS